MLLASCSGQDNNVPLPPPLVLPSPSPPEYDMDGVVSYEYTDAIRAPRSVIITPTQRRAASRVINTPIIESRAISTDEIVSQLKQANLALTVPKSSNIRNDVPVKLLVSVEQSQQDLIDELNASSNSYVISDNVKISKTMSASITAPDFDINIITPVRQAITEGTTEWIWSLRPKTSGTHHITVTLVAHVMVDGERVEKHIKTFDKTLQIEITTHQKLTDFFLKYWQWLFTTLLIPIGIGIWKYIHRKKDK